MHPSSWLFPRPEGLYCAPGDFFIDPIRPVARAVITHGHGDHARPNNAAVLATPETIGIMQVRFGEAAGGSLDPLPLIEGTELLEGAMQVDRRVEAGLAENDDHPLAFAEPIGAEEMGAVGIGGDRGDEALRLAGGVLVAEDRQAEGRLGDEEIAAPELEGRAGRVGGALVVAGDDRAGALPGQLNLS